MKIIALILCFFCCSIYAQEVSSDSADHSGNFMIDNIDLEIKNPLQASLYSAIIPGLGQIYNEQYWKAPLVWGLIGTGVGVSVHYNSRYHHYRDAFVAELDGNEHPYTGIFDKNRLGAIQDDMRRNRDYAIALTILAYALNILDATVDAHLYEIRRDRDLSVDPTAFVDPYTGQTNFGLALKLNLN